MTRQTLYKIMNRLVRMLTRSTFEGEEYIPKEGPVIVATNHLSRLDTLLLFVNSVRPDITALVADKYKTYPVFNWILKTGGIIWLDRENADFGALRAAVAALKEGLPLGIAPEGTRSTTGGLIEGKPGTVLVALRSGAPIVPVGISGTENVFTRIFTLQRPKLLIRFGPAFSLPPLDRDRRDEQMREYTDEIMCRIAVLLPEKNRGVYRDHPRVQQLLASQSA